MAAISSAKQKKKMLTIRPAIGGNTHEVAAIAKRFDATRQFTNLDVGGRRE